MKFIDGRTRGKNHDFTKRVNRAAVLDMLRRHKGLMRAELARGTGLSAQSASNIVAAFEKSGLIKADSKIYGGMGQPPTPYFIAPEAGFAIGINLDEQRLWAALTDFSYTVRARCQHPHDKRTLEEILPILHAAIAQLLAEAGLSTDRLWGIGLAAPQLVDTDLADVEKLEESLWVALGAGGLPARLAATAGSAVFVENDANAGALGELIFGAGQGLQHFCYLHAARGLGLGIIHDRRLYRGAGGNAGEIGRIRLLPHAAAPIEDILSVAGRSEAAARPNGESQWLGDAGRILHWLVGIIENAFDPQTVILGGHFERQTASQLIETALPLSMTIADRLRREAARLQVSPLGPESAALGASVIPFLGTIEPQPARNWRFHGSIRDIYAS